MALGVQWYRQLLRELSKQHKSARMKHLNVARAQYESRQKLAERSGKPYNIPPPPSKIEAFNTQQLRDLISVLPPVDESNLSEVLLYLKNQRVYKELLERYQGIPVDGEERVRQSAKRVGLEID